MARTTNDEKTIIKYDASKTVAVSSELYDVSRYRWHMNTLGYRTLFCIAQCMDRQAPMRQLHIKKDAMFEYLGLTTTNRRYDLLGETLKNVRQAGLDSVTVNKRGKKEWQGHSIVTDYKFTEEDEYVHIAINDYAIPFLTDLKQFALIQPKTYLRLSTDYQNWFYPFLKLRLNLGKWEISIDDLSDALALEQSKAYNKENKDYVSNILKRVVGIQPSAAYKEEQKLAKAEGREPQFRSWDFVKGADGKPTGTLWTISKETDIEVVAQAIKVGRSFSKIQFLIREREETKSSKRKQQEYEEILNSADIDMGAQQDRTERRGSSVPYTSENKIPESYHTDEELRTLIGSIEGINTIEDVARLMKLQRGKIQGTWIRK